MKNIIIFIFLFAFSFFYVSSLNKDIVRLQKVYNSYISELTKYQDFEKAVPKMQSYFYLLFKRVSKSLNSLDSSFGNLSCSDQLDLISLLQNLGNPFEQSSIFVNMQAFKPANVKFQKLLQSAPTNC